MEDGRFTLHMEQVDLQAEFEDAIFTYRELFRQEGIELTYDGGDEDCPPSPGTPSGSSRCSAMCWTTPPSTAAPASASTPPSAGRESSWWSGSGTTAPAIPEAELPFIKQKFYKGSSKARGSGIGLAVCDEIVGLHNGIFTIGNAVGGGAEVTIRLPIKE